MKLMRILLTLAVMLSMLLPMGVYADDSLADNKGQSVDIVVVMDHSSSMDKNGNKNDTDGNRIVAAEMITAMCDMNGSRVAFVPFNRDIVSQGTFVDMSVFENADDLRADIARYSPKIPTASRRIQTLGGTDYGSALAYAYNLLCDAKDEGSANSPMIIVLSDGQQDLTVSDKNYSKDIYFWNEAQKRYTLTPIKQIRAVKTPEDIANNPTFKDLYYYDGLPLTSLSASKIDNFKVYEGEDADQLAIDVAQRCKDARIPVYTLPLHAASKSNDSFIGQLSLLSDITNATSSPLSSANADQLPFFFGDMFADKIGSTQRLLSVKPSAEIPGEYVVDIPLLNSSVQEANIYIPLKYVDAESIYLKDSTGSIRRVNNSDIIRIEIEKAFVLYKLRVEDPLGMWKLYFRTSKDNIQPADISFSLLYNYNITLNSTLNGTGSGVSLSKSSSVDLVSFFFDNETGAKSLDTNLYVPCQPDLAEEDKIKFTYRILNASRQPISGAEGVMTYDAGQQVMKATVDLSAFDLLSGDYYCMIIADGAGLHRENLIPVTLTNTAPTETARIQGTLNVEYQDDPSTYNPQTITFNLNDYVDDIDRDALTFGNLQYTAGDGLSTITLNGPTLEVRSKQDPATGHFLYGLQQGTVTADDGDQGTCDIHFSFQINSGWADANDCDYNTTVSGVNNNIAAKNSPVTFSMTRVSKSTGAQLGVDLISGSVTITDTATGRTIDTLTMAPSADGSALECTYQTGNTASSWIATCAYAYNGAQISSTDIPVVVVNNAPTAQTAEAAAHLLPKKLTYNASFFSFLEEEQPTATVDLTQFFSDVDNELGLVYAMDPAQSGDDALDCTISGSSLTLTGKGAGNIPFTVIATDGDGAVASFNGTIMVVDIFMCWLIRLLILLAAIIALIIAIIAVIRHNKPKLPEDGMLTVTLGRSLYPITGQPVFTFRNIHNPKDPLPLNAVVTIDTCDTVQYEYADLAHIRLFPVKNSDKLRVVLDKKPVSFIVKIDNDDAKTLSAGKSALIRPEQEITLQSVANADAEHCLHVSYSLGGANDIPDDHDGEFIGENLFKSEGYSTGVGGYGSSDNGFDGGSGFDSSAFKPAEPTFSAPAQGNGYSSDQNENGFVGSFDSPFSGQSESSFTGGSFSSGPSDSSFSGDQNDNGFGFSSFSGSQNGNGFGDGN